MIIVWTILFAMAAETGGHSTPSAFDRVRPVIDSAIRAHHPIPSRSMLVAKKVRYRACSAFATWSGPEEFDTEEVDETWMVQLDAIATVPACWLGLAWSRYRSVPADSSGIGLLPPSHFPLRC